MVDKKLIDKKECMGCHACKSICPYDCISMEADTEGFLYPKVDYSICIKCDKCVDVCPIINKSPVDNKPKAFACINNNEEVRLHSSSGGIFTLIAEEVIDQGGVVFGAGFNETFEVEHSFAKVKVDLERFRGSKYVQSRIGETYKQVKDFLISNYKVLFTGTPCQIAGLKTFIGKKCDNLLTIDLICHGVPSPSVWRKYVDFREIIAGSPVQRIDFRHKNESWKRYSVLFLFKNNTEYREPRDKDLYMKAFLKDVCLRPSCYDCKFKGVNRQSDITLADFWGVQDVLPEMDDDKGTSIIFVNSESGQELFEKIKNRMVYREVDISEAVKYNSTLIKSVNYNPKRDGFMKEKRSLPFDKLVNKYCKDKLLIRIRRSIKVILRKIMIK